MHRPNKVNAPNVKSTSIPTKPIVQVVVIVLLEHYLKKGSFSNERGKVCIACIQGQYRQSKKEDGVTTTDPTTCVDCPAGWSSEAGSTKCQSCEAGTYSNVLGEDCKPCDIGQYRPSQIKVDGVMTDTELTKCK